MSIKQALHEVDSEIHYWSNKDGTHHEQAIYALFVRILQRIRKEMFHCCNNCAEDYLYDPEYLDNVCGTCKENL